MAPFNRGVFLKKKCYIKGWRLKVGRKSMWRFERSEWVNFPGLASSKRATHTHTRLPEELIASLSETQISRPTDERHSIRWHLSVKSAKPTLGCPPDFKIEAIFREVPVVWDGGVSEVQPALEWLQPQCGLHLQGPPCPTCKLDNHKIFTRPFVCLSLQ